MTDNEKTAVVENEPYNPENDVNSPDYIFPGELDAPIEYLGTLEEQAWIALDEAEFKLLDNPPNPFISSGSHISEWVGMLLSDAEELNKVLKSKEVTERIRELENDLERWEYRYYGE